MGLYAEKILPWGLDVTDPPEIDEQRASALQSVAGRVLELGLGTGAEAKDADFLRLDIAYLDETLANRDCAIFGPSSEKRPRIDTRTKTKDATAQRGHGPSEQPELPIIEVICDGHAAYSTLRKDRAAAGNGDLH